MAEIEDLKIEIQNTEQPPEAEGITVSIPDDTPNWEDLGDYEAVKKQLSELKQLQDTIKDLPLEKIAFLKRGGDPIEALEEYKKVFDTDYAKLGDDELIKNHLMATGKTAKQAEVILKQFRDLDDDLDDDYQERMELLTKYKEEALNYFTEEQNKKREEYESAMGLGTPQELIDFADNVKDVSLDVDGDIKIQYKVPKEYVDTARDIIKGLPQMRNVPQEQYQETLNGILWLNPDVRSKMIQQAVMAAVRQTEAKLQEQITQLKDEHKKNLLGLSGLNKSVAGQVDTGQLRNNRVYPEIGI